MHVSQMTHEAVAKACERAFQNGAGKVLLVSEEGTPLVSRHVRSVAEARRMGFPGEAVFARRKNPDGRYSFRYVAGC